MEAPYITVFTPTYNRRILLERLYQSLLGQTAFPFEWLIIDDDSSDGTEAMVQEWILRRDQAFTIRYYRQPHGGKHRALNRGFALAEGVYFFIVDSDDSLADHALAYVEQWGKAVESRPDIAGVAGLKVSGTGVQGGRPSIPKGNDWVEAGNLERGKYNLWGDKAEVYKTRILKKYPFPEFAGEYFVTEAVCWDAIAADGYKLRWYNVPIYHCEYLADGLTRSGANDIKGHLENYRGFCYYIHQCMEVKTAWNWSGDLRRYNRVARRLKKSWRTRAADLKIRFSAYLAAVCLVMPVVYSGKVFAKALQMVRRKAGGMS